MARVFSFRRIAAIALVWLSCAPAAATTFYVDPQNGSTSGDGSSGRPWRRFADLFEKSSGIIGPVVKPGDTIVLHGGDHGATTIAGSINAVPIVVEAAEGQRPILRQTKLIGARGWVFRGLTFQGEGPRKAGPADALLEIGRSTWLGPTSDIVVERCEFATADDTSGWSAQDWVNKPYYNALITFGTNIAIRDNRFHNIRNGLSINGEDVAVERNVIENVGNDGMSINGSRLRILNNTIRAGRHTPAEPLHADGIQGFPARDDGVNRDVLIDGNRIEAGPSGDYMQGITIFDGRWENVRVTNNTIETRAWHGIAFFGVTGGLIAGNRVIAADPKQRSWIMVTASKTGRPSSGIELRDNISPAYKIDRR